LPVKNRPADANLGTNQRGGEQKPAKNSTKEILHTREKRGRAGKTAGKKDKWGEKHKEAEFSKRGPQNGQRNLEGLAKKKTGPVRWGNFCEKRKR